MSTTMPDLHLTRDALAADEWPALRSDHRTGRVVRVWPGVYVDAESWAGLAPERRRRMRIDAALAATGHDYAFCDESAATLWGLPLVGCTDDRVTVIAPTLEGGRSSGLLVKRATVAPRELQRLDGLLVTTAAQTAVDVARRLPFASALAAADDVLRRGLVTVADLDEARMRMVRCHGFARADRVVREADGRAESPLESVSRAVMLQLGVPRPELQHPLVDALGRTRRPDFFWPDLGLIGECDGRVKYEDASMTRGRSAADIMWDEKQREDALRALGHRVVRWGWREATDPPRLARLLAAAGLHPTRPDRHPYSLA